MTEKWIVGQPEGPSGPFWSVISSSGRVIAMQIVDKDIAQRIANLPNLAEVVHKQGRYHLIVNGVFVATEGDLIRDTKLPNRLWDKETLEKAASIINQTAA